MWKNVRSWRPNSQTNWKIEQLWKEKLFSSNRITTFLFRVVQFFQSVWLVGRQLWTRGEIFAHISQSAFHIPASNCVLDLISLLLFWWSVWGWGPDSPIPQTITYHQATISEPLHAQSINRETVIVNLDFSASQTERDRKRRKWTNLGVSKITNPRSSRKFPLRWELYLRLLSSQ